MKKFYAIVLGLLMVLGLASIACAEFAISGQFVVKEEYNVTTSTYGAPGVGDSRLEVKLSGTYGDASGDIKFRLKDQTQEIGLDDLWNDLDGDGIVDYVDDPLTPLIDESKEVLSPVKISKYVQIRTANLQYKLSDAFSVGAVYDVSGDVDFYSDPVYGDYEPAILGNGYEIDDTTYPWMKVNIASGDFKAMILNNLFRGEEIEIRAGATYAFDPVTIGGALMYKPNGDYAIVPGVSYALSDELSLAGEVYYESVGGTTWYEVGFGAAYATDTIEVAGALYYDVDASDIDFYDVDATYYVSDVFDVYFGYHSVDLVTLGADWKLDGEAGKVAFNFEYAQAGAAADTFTSKITIKF